MRIYEYTDGDRDRLIVGTLVDNRFMVTVEDSANRRRRVVMPTTEARELRDALTAYLGESTSPLTEERVREIAKAVLADYDVPAIARSAGIQATRDQLRQLGGPSA